MHKTTLSLVTHLGNGGVVEIVTARRRGVSTARASMDVDTTRVRLRSIGHLASALNIRQLIYDVHLCVLKERSVRVIWMCECLVGE